MWFILRFWDLFMVCNWDSAMTMMYHMEKIKFTVDNVKSVFKSITCMPHWLFGEETKLNLGEINWWSLLCVQEAMCKSLKQAIHNCARRCCRNTKLRLHEDKHFTSTEFSFSFCKVKLLLQSLLPLAIQKKCVTTCYPSFVFWSCLWPTWILNCMG